MSAPRPLVSVITPTWQRAELLRGAIENVRAQTYRPLQHVIVVEGWGDDDTLDVLTEEAEYDNGRWGLADVVLGRNWSTFLPDSFCAAPMTVGMLLARGEYQTWLADDERMAPDHIASLVDALESSDGADFAYSRAELWWESGRREVIGTDPPSLGQITNLLYRAAVLKHGLYPFGAGMTSDWQCISRWQSHGAKHVYVDRVTLSHRVDH